MAATRALAGAGRVVVPAPPEAVWAALLDPETLAALIPGAERVERPEHGRFLAVLSLGVGRLRGRYGAELRLSGVEPPRALDLAGESSGALGRGWAAARVVLSECAPGRTAVEWRYEGAVSGPVALAGGAPLRIASRLFVGRFFAALARAPFPATGGLSGSRA